MGLQSENTSFTFDNIGRFLCNTLQEALDSAAVTVAGRAVPEPSERSRHTCCTPLESSMLLRSCRGLHILQSDVRCRHRMGADVPASCRRSAAAHTLSR